MKEKCLIAVDWDCTLYYYDYDKPVKIELQDVIPLSKESILRWIKAGHKVYICSAKADSEENISKMRVKLDADGLSKVKTVTNKKLPDTDYLIDDIAVHVCPNEGFKEYIVPTAYDHEYATAAKSRF